MDVTSRIRQAATAQRNESLSKLGNTSLGTLGGIAGAFNNFRALANMEAQIRDTKANGGSVTSISNDVIKNLEYIEQFNSQLFSGFTIQVKELSERSIDQLNYFTHRFGTATNITLFPAIITTL